MTTPLPTVAVAPDADPVVVAAVVATGARLVIDPADAEVLVWTSSRDPIIIDPRWTNLRWVQLPSAGIERWADEIRGVPGLIWTSASGAFAQPVAEHAIALLLAATHRLAEHAADTSWQRRQYRPLQGSRVTVLGAGGIGRHAITLLEPHGVEVVAVNRSGEPVPGATRTVTLRQWRTWAEVDHVIASLPSSTQTHGALGTQQLALLGGHSVVVNVGRGDVLDHDAASRALATGRLGGLALDVTDPEPLPADHALWRQPRALITSHSANPTESRRAHFARHVQENLRRYVAGRPVLARVDLGG